MRNKINLDLLRIEQEKRRRLKKKLKKALKFKVIGNAEYNKDLVRDVKYIHEDLLDFLLLDTFKNSKQYIESVNCFFSLECKAYEFDVSIKYKPNKMFDCVKLLLMKHEARDLINT